jgi:hypothetical protein
MWFQALGLFFHDVRKNTANPQKSKSVTGELFPGKNINMPRESLVCPFLSIPSFIQQQNTSIPQ